MSAPLTPPSPPTPLPPKLARKTPRVLLPTDPRTHGEPPLEPERALAHVKVILCRPQESRNIGVTLRICANMGVGELIVVRPMEWDEILIQGCAPGISDGFARLRRVESIADALVGLTNVWATSRRAHANRPMVQLPAWRDFTAHPDEPTGILFGNERTGLEWEEIEAAHKVLCIPTEADSPSMNLAQSVSVVLWEMRRERLTTRPVYRSPLRPSPPADAALRMHLLKEWRVMLDAIDLFRGHNPERVMRPFAMWFDRQDLKRSEAQLLLGLTQRVLQKLGLKVPRARRDGERPPSNGSQ